MSEVQLALAKFMLDIWDVYCEDPNLDIESVMTKSPLFSYVEATEKDIEEGNAPEGYEEGDQYYTLSPLGKEAWEIVNKDVLAKQRER